MNLALVADWLPVFGGAENVIAQFTKMYPGAPLFTTIANHGKLKSIDQADIRTTRLQKYYKLLGTHRVLLPWMPRAMEDIDLRGYDVILSSSHAVGKGVIPPSDARHICYCHTPMRYAWEMEEEYLEKLPLGWISKPYAKKKLQQLREWDLATSKRVDTFIANSTETKNRIERIYERESVVVSPPVEQRFFEGVGRRGSGVGFRNYFLAIGRLVPYKRFDLLIEWANTHKTSLVIAGTGPDEKRLQRLAKAHVTFAGFVPDSDLPALFSNAKALLFPQFEDAGIVPLEAQATGTPVIAYAKGGALDSVVDRKTGVFFSEQSIDAIQDAIERFEHMEFDREEIQEHARRFSEEGFRETMHAILA